MLEALDYLPAKTSFSLEYCASFCFILIFESTFLSYPTQQTIKQLLIAEAMITVGLIRGYASGTISIPQAQMQLDYSMLLEMGKTEKERVMTELKERLENMTPWKQMENYATMSNQLMEILKNKPLGGFYVI